MDEEDLIPEFSFGLITVEMPVRHPREKSKWTFGQMGLELRSEIWKGDRNLRVMSM